MSRLRFCFINYERPLNYTKSIRRQDGGVVLTLVSFYPFHNSQVNNRLQNHFVLLSSHFLFFKEEFKPRMNTDETRIFIKSQSKEIKPPITPMNTDRNSLTRDLLPSQSIGVNQCHRWFKKCRA